MLRPAHHRFALEPRQMFDAAAAAEAVQIVQTSTAQPAAAPEADEAPGTGATEPVRAVDYPAPRRELAGEAVYVIDAAVRDADIFSGSIPEGAIVLYLAAGESGMNQLADALGAIGDVGALHLISHGTEGSFTLGSDTLDAANLFSFQAQWATVAAALRPGADILLYGCRIAADGGLLVDQMARMTGADVAASIGDTGAQVLGGDWVLEYRTGTIEGAVLAAEAYGWTLAAPSLAATAGVIAVGENTGGVVGAGITVGGTGAELLRASASVTAGKGTLAFDAVPAGVAIVSGSGSASFVFEGAAADLQAALAALRYTYVGSSEAGDSDTLSLSIENRDTGGTATLTGGRAITVQPQNDAPTVLPPAFPGGAGLLTVAEGGNVAFAAPGAPGGIGTSQVNLGLIDADNSTRQVIIKIMAVPTSGVLTLNGLEVAVGQTLAASDIAGLRYVHGGGQVLAITQDSFRINVDDGAGGLVTDVVIPIALTPVNDAPSAAGTITLIEGETGVSLSGGSLPVPIGGGRGSLTITDPDQADGVLHTVQVTVLPAHGVLRYNGAVVSAGQDIAGFVPALLTYDHDGSETTADSFRIQVTDDGGGAGGGARLTSPEQTISLSIIPNNDDPTLPVNTGVVLGQGQALAGPEVTLTRAMLQAADADSPDDRLTYTLTRLPTGGYLISTDFPGMFLPAGFAFKQSELDAGKIRFVATDPVPFVTGFDFTLTDSSVRLWPAPQREGGLYANDTTTTLEQRTFRIQSDGLLGPGLPQPLLAAPVNAAPMVGGSLAIGPDRVAEGQTVTLTTADLGATDPDNLPAELVYRIGALPTHGRLLFDGNPLVLAGSFTQADVNAGRISFQHDGAEVFSGSFTFTLSDGKLATGAQTFSFNVLPQNDTPTVAGAEQALRVTEGGSVAAGLSVRDRDNDGPTDSVAGYAEDNALFLEVVSLPDPLTGELRLGGVAVVAGSLLSTAQLAQLTYHHLGAERYTDSFQVRPVDDRAVIAAGTPAGNPTNQPSVGATVTVDITVLPVNDAPTFVGKREGVLREGESIVIQGAASYAGGLAGVTGSGTPTAPATGAYLSYSDSDNATDQRQYRITTAPAHGTVRLNGQVLGANSVFTQADLDAGRITYVHDGSETEADFFDYVVSDGDWRANETSAFAQGDAATPGRFNFAISGTNDAPSIAGPVGPVRIDSTVAANNPVVGFVVSDIDLTDGVGAAEIDFVQVTLRLLDSTGVPITDYTTGFAGGGVSIAIATPTDTAGRWAATRTGANDIVQFQGSRDQVNAALAGLTVTFANDCDAVYRLQVIVDDRVRDAAGNLDVSGSDANGGELNQGRPAGSAATPVPGTVFDWATAVAVPADDPNIVARTVELWASSENDVAIFTAPVAATVAEDVRTRVSGAFVVSDAESTAFGTPVTVTLTVPAGNGGTLGIGAPAASTSLTPSGGQAVAISGDNTRQIILTGRAGDIQALLNGRNFADTADDAIGGVFYRSAANVNHDLNGVGDGDVTLDARFEESASAIGGDTGAGSVANPALSASVALTITAVNDAPSISMPGPALVVSGTAPITLAGVVVSDVDANNGYATGESDGIVQVLVRLLQPNGTPLAAADYTSLGATFDTSAIGHGATVDGTLTGSGMPIAVRGTLVQVNAWLAGLRLTFADLGNANVDQAYAIEVIADDRLRDVHTGALVGGANGGATNQVAGLPAVPPTDTFDVYSDTVSAYNVYNVVRATRSVFVSSINDPGSIRASNVVVAEASATLVLAAGNAGITIDDPDDNDAANLTATVTLPDGSGLVFSAVGGSDGSVLGTGTRQLTLTGTEAQLNTRLQALTVAFADPDGMARAQDWNGSFTVTVVYNDAGNTGTRPAGIPGDTDLATADPGDFDWADGIGGTSAALVTTRTFTVTVTPVNDAPVRLSGSVGLAAAPEDSPGGGGALPPGDTVANLFGGVFSDALDQVNHPITGGSDADAFAGIAITTNNASAAQGAWQYSADGNHWTEVSAVTESSALALRPTDRLRFVPAADYHGTPGGLVVRLADGSGAALDPDVRVDVSGANSGGNTRFSDSLNAVTLVTTVAPVNDRPTAAGTTLAATFEDNPDPAGATLSALGFGYSDAIDDRTAIAGGGNTASALGGYAIVGNAVNPATEGRWQYNAGGGWFDVGAVSDAAAVLLPTSASLRFLPAADFNGTPGALSLRLADSSVPVAATGVDLSGSVGPTGTWSLPVTLATSVDPRNDAPVLSGTVNATFTEGSPAAALLGGATASDIDLPGVVTFGGGRITVTLDTWRAGDVLSLAGTPAGVTGTSGGSGGISFVVNLDTAATPATIGTILGALRYENTSDDPIGHLLGIDDFDRAYTIVLNDGNNVNGAANAGGNGGGDPSLDSNVLAGVITVVPVNDPPVATDDANTLSETTASVSGNVKTGLGGTLDTDPDHLNAELSVDAIRSGGVEGAGTAGTVGGPALAGLYGALTIAANGDYTYTLDTAHPQVKALSAGETLQERFNYRITDPDGGRDTAVLTLTITGVDDGGPSIIAVDGNGAAAGQATVFESGLVAGGPAGESRTATGTLGITAPSGLASVTIAGSSFTVAQLSGFSVGSPSAIIDTGEGQLRLTGLTVTAGAASAPTAATVSYEYTLKAAIVHAGAAADESIDSIALLVTDATSAAASASGTLTVRIVDDVPTARADVGAVVAGSIASALQTSGNVVTAVAAGDTSDRLGADAVATPVTALSANGTAGVPGTALAGRYGLLRMDASGAYVYRADQANPALAVLGPGLTLIDVFDYTVTDADGDSSTATLTITLRAEALPPPLPTGGSDRPMVDGDRRDRLPAADPRRPVNMQMEPSLHVQRAVRETAAGTLEHGRLIQGLALPPGSELHSESLSIADGMDPTEHVSRDGVRYSRQLVADGQERPGSLGNALVIGNQSLFDPFSPFGTREGLGQSTEAPPVVASAAGDMKPGDVAAQPSDETRPAQTRDGSDTLPLLATATATAPVAAWAGFTQQLRQIALERALVREGQAAPGPLRAAQLPAMAGQEGTRTIARTG